MKEKTLNSKLIYKGKILNLRLDTVTLSNGKEAKREIIEHSGPVAILPLICEDKFLLIQQYRKPAEKVLLEIPAGRIEKGENLKECANRELEEETGYKARDLKKLTSVYPTPGYSSEIMHVFLAKNLKKSKPKPDEDEHIKTVILDKKEVLDRITSGEIEDSKTVIGILLYLQNKPKKRGI